MAGTKRQREEASTSSKASVAKSPDKGKGKAVNGKSAKGTPKAAKHHAAEDGENKSKKRKSSETASRPAPAAAAPQEVDFPRGGATGLTPLEYREATREARAEASRDEALFQDESVQKSKAKRQKLNRDKANAKKKGITTTSGVEEKPKLDYQRVEHLSYKVSVRPRNHFRETCANLRSCHPLSLAPCPWLASPLLHCGSPLSRARRFATKSTSRSHPNHTHQLAAYFAVAGGRRSVGRGQRRGGG